MHLAFSFCPESHTRQPADYTLLHMCCHHALECALQAVQPLKRSYTASRVLVVLGSAFTLLLPGDVLTVKSPTDLLWTHMCRNKKSRQEVALSPFRWMIKYFGWNGNPTLCIHLNYRSY